MADLLIRNIDPSLERRLQESAREHNRTLSEEARMVLKHALSEPPDNQKMGTALFSLIPKEFRGDDLVFEIPGEVGRPADFE